MKNNFVNSTLKANNKSVINLVTVEKSVSFFFFSTNRCFVTVQAQQLVFQWKFGAVHWKENVRDIFTPSFTHCSNIYCSFKILTWLWHFIELWQSPVYEHICPCNCYTVLYISSSNRVLVLLTIHLASFISKISGLLLHVRSD